jgi:hypothetical protein
MNGFKALQSMTRDELLHEVRQLRQLIVDADMVTRARFENYGLCDSIDNRGLPYPSQWSADIVRRCRETNTPDERLKRHAG